MTGTGPLDDSHRVMAVSECLGAGPVIDVGAGPCLLRPFADGHYFPVDVDVELLEAGSTSTVASVTDLPFRDCVAGTTTCVSVLQYVLDVERAMEELHRVTRPGGTVIALVPNLSYALSVLKLARGRLPWSSPLDDWRSGTIRYFTRADFGPMVESKGFRIVDVRCSGRFRRLRSRWPNFLGADLLFLLERI